MKLYKNFSSKLLGKKANSEEKALTNDVNFKREEQNQSGELIERSFSQASEKERKTISFQLGKTLIDTFNGNQSKTELPLKLFDLYIESLKRKNTELEGIKKVLLVVNDELLQKEVMSLKTINPPITSNTSDKLKLGNAKEKAHSASVKGTALSSGNTDIAPYMSLEAFVSSLDSKNKLEVDINKNFWTNIGIKDTKVFRLIDESIVKVNSIDNKVIYTKAQALLPCTEGEIYQCRFDITALGDINVTVVLEFYNKDQTERLDIKILPLNKALNFNVPEKAEYLRLGLKIQGKGIIEKNKVVLKKKDSLVPKSNRVIDWQLQEGISIIIPSYKGEATILETLGSIALQQNIDFSLLEILIVINGEMDNSVNLIKDFAKLNSKLNIKVSTLKKSSASLARNYGIKKASREYIVFCDDDDMLSPNYLSALYQIAAKDAIGFNYIHDLHSDGRIDQENSINNSLTKAAQEGSHDYSYFNSALTMIACKILPTANLKNMRFDERLKSGEDVVFFSAYYSYFKPKLNITPIKDSFYIRRLRDNSVSRQKLSFDFNITQRLEVIKALFEIKYNGPQDIISTKVRAQCGFIVRYLREFPEDYLKFHLKIIELNITDFPYKYLQSKLDLPVAETLVISFCYAPFVDTSAVIVSKRIYERGVFCDVVSANMSKVRKIDTALMQIDAHLVKDTYLIDLIPAFGNWKCFQIFTSSMLNAVSNKKYKNIYSRSFWPASHFAAFEYKRQNPAVEWVAEFSDPIILDIEGNPRFSEISKDWVESVVNEFNLDQVLLNELNLYVWAELLVYLLADEIIFTCDNQKTLMLEKFPYQTIATRAQKVSIITPHPSLPKEFYISNKVQYELDNAKVNMAYFGAFYKTRRLDDLIEVIKWYHENKLNYKSIKMPHIHIFTEQVDAAKLMIQEEGLDSYFTINPYLSYMDFLAVSNQMDVLIVNDAKANEIFGLNPYLPSKISDYLNSDAKIWAFYEEGSALSNDSNINASSKIGDDKSSREALLILIK